MLTEARRLTMSWYLLKNTARSYFDWSPFSIFWMISSTISLSTIGFIRASALLSLWKYSKMCFLKSFESPVSS
jgi:hypothetical protein